MKLPKTVFIAGQEWKVKLDPNLGGGHFEGGKAAITIGTKYPHNILNTFLHEIMEATLSKRNLRYVLGYDQPTNGDYRFIFNHREFENVIKDIAFSLKGFFK